MTVGGRGGLGSPRDWVYKGEGAANVVYEYRGDLEHLAGRVLKVRKRAPGPAPGTDARLEAAVWEPVLGRWDQWNPMDRELGYVQRCLVPLLGAQHVPEQEPVQVDPEFLTQLPSPSSNGSAAPDPCSTAAVLMPDVTRFEAPGPASDGGSGSGNGSSAGVSAGLQPALCVEIKPKCGFLGACPTVHPDNRIKHSKSRYQLHQLLKHSEGKVGAPSAYDPLDLFSQEPQRMLGALRALLAHPQNNLKLFWGGRPVGAAEGLREWAAAGGSSSDSAGGGSDSRGQESNQEAGEAEERLLSLLMQILSLEGVLERLLAAQQQCQYDIEGVYALYCKLRASAAEEQQCGSSSSSLATSTQEPQPLERQPASLVKLFRGDSADQCSAGPALQPQHAPDGRPALATATAGLTGEGGCSAPGSSSGEQPPSSHEAVQRLLALPLGEAHAVLRQYVVSATAKDCALMVSLQRLAEGAPAAGGGGDPSCGPLAGEGQQPLMGQPPPSPHQAEACGWQRLVRCARSGAWYRYRLAFVDLDMKPLAKIPQHYALDQRILAAARQHSGGGGGAS